MPVQNNANPTNYHPKIEISNTLNFSIETNKNLIPIDEFFNKLEDKKNKLSAEIVDLNNVIADWRKHPAESSIHAKLLGTALLVSGVGLAILSVPLLLFGALGMTTFELSLYMIKDGWKSLTNTPETVINTCMETCTQIKDDLKEVLNQTEMLKNQLLKKKAELENAPNLEKLPEIKDCIKKEIDVIDSLMDRCQNMLDTSEPARDKPSYMKRMLPTSQPWTCRLPQF